MMRQGGARAAAVPRSRPQPGTAGSQKWLLL